jgi:hypothetical protein
METKLLECIENGTHLVNCDNDGFCNVCGFQDEPMRFLLEKQIIEDANNGDTTVLASLLEMLTDVQIYNALSDVNQAMFNNPKNYLPFAISTSDGHDEDWTYYPNESEMLKAFESLKHNESNIHVYEYNSKLGYEVIDSFWIGDYVCPECTGEEVYYTGNETMMCECGYKGELFEFQKKD